MNSHELARILLANPDLPIATHANNHTFTNSPRYDATRVGVMLYGGSSHILIGNFSRKRINHPSEVVTEMIHGDVPEDWGTR